MIASLPGRARYSYRSTAAIWSARARCPRSDRPATTTGVGRARDVALNVFAVDLILRAVRRARIIHRKAFLTSALGPELGSAAAKPSVLNI